MKLLEGIGGSNENSKANPISSSCSKFKKEVIKRKKEQDDKEMSFWAMKGVKAPLRSEKNIRYRDSLAP